jgi:hypothetical protein
MRDHHASLLVYLGTYSVMDSVILSVDLKLLHTGIANMNSNKFSAVTSGQS